MQTTEIDVMTAMVDAFIAITKTRQLTEERLAPVVTAAEHDSMSVRAVGMSRLAVLAHYFEPARKAYVRTMDASNAVKQMALSTLPNAPLEVVEQVVDVGLTDEDVQIRKSAARMAATQVSETLARTVREALATELDARVRVVLEQSARFHDSAGGA